MVKRIYTDLRASFVLTSLAAGLCICIVITAVSIATNTLSQLFRGVIGSLAFTTLLVLVSLILAQGQVHKLKKRIKACAGSVSLEQEAYYNIAKQLACGKEWLVYHNRNTYLFWTKGVITKIDLVQRNGLMNKGTLIIYSQMHPEGEEVRFTSSSKENIEKLMAWYTE